MKKSFLMVGAAGLVAALALSGQWLLGRSAPTGVPDAGANKVLTEQVAQASPAAPGSQSPAQALVSVAKTADNKANMQNNASGSPGTESPSTVATRAVVNPALTRSLEPPPTFQIEDRKWSVLGTRVVPSGDGKNDQNGPKTVLVLRDEVSGQLDFRQSALRFVLQPGTDYEAFIRERRHAQRVFVNPLYGDISVDPASIAAEYMALASDKRVVKVQFIALVVQAKPR